MVLPLDNKQNLGWAKTVGVLPIHNGAEQDEHFKTEQFKGWFEELSNPDKYVFVTPPTHLENLGVFYDSMVPTGFQEVLLGKNTPKEVADEWAKYLTAEQQKYMAATSNRRQSWQRGLARQASRAALLMLKQDDTGGRNSA